MKMKIYYSRPKNLVVVALGKGSSFRFSEIFDFPGPNIKSTVDSSRYFVMTVRTTVNPEVGELIGLGFYQAESELFTKTLIDCLSTPTDSEQEQDDNKVLEVPITTEEEDVKEKEEADQTDPVSTEDTHYDKSSEPPEILFDCQICPEIYDDMRHIKSHWRTVHGFLDPRHCTQCPQVFYSPELFSKHKLKQHGLTCEFCYWRGEGEPEMKKHYEEKHQKTLQFKCTVTDCVELFDSRTLLKDHLKTEHGPSTLFKCPKCCSEFIYEMEMSFHYSSHGRIRCGICLQRFDSVFQINGHLRSVHKGQKEPEVRLS